MGWNQGVYGARKQCKDSSILTPIESFRTKSISSTQNSKRQIYKKLLQLKSNSWESKRRSHSLYCKITIYYFKENWELGRQPINIKIKAEAKPFHTKSYRIPHSIYLALKKEVNRLVDIGFLSPNPNSHWASPSFAIPKKEGNIRFISNAHQHNKSARRKPFLFPCIQDIQHSITQLQWVTAVDLSMGYYHMKLNKKSRNCCTIVLLWGKYCYDEQPMGLCDSMDIFQCTLGTLFLDLQHLLLQIDDNIVIGTGS